MHPCRSDRLRRPGIREALRTRRDSLAWRVAHRRAHSTHPASHRSPGGKSQRFLRSERCNRAPALQAASARVHRRSAQALGTWPRREPPTGPREPRRSREHSTVAGATRATRDPQRSAMKRTGQTSCMTPPSTAAQSSGHASPTGVLDIELSVERSRPQDSRAVPPPRRRERQERTDSGQAEQHGCAKSTARSPLGKAPAPRRTHDVALASKVGLAGICRHEPNAGVVRLAVRGSRAACWILAGRKPCVHIKQRPRELTTREASAFWRALEDLNLWPSDS